MSEFVDLDGWGFRFNGNKSFQLTDDVRCPAESQTYVAANGVGIWDVAVRRIPFTSEFEVYCELTRTYYGRIERTGARWSAYGAAGGLVTEEWLRDRERAVKAILERL